MVVLARRGPVQSVMYLWLRLRWGVTGSHLTGQTRTMNRLASGQTEEAGTGTAQGNAACHSCSAGRLLVVVAAYPDLAKEAASATGLGVGQREAGTGTAQGSAACRSCSAGRLLVVVPAYPDLAKEAASGAATGLGVERREAGTGTAQGSAAYHSCSAGRLLVVVAAYPDLAKEVVSEAATGLGVGWSPLVQEQEHRLGTFACGFVYEG